MGLCILSDILICSAVEVVEQTKNLQASIGKQLIDAENQQDQNESELVLAKCEQHVSPRRKNI